MSAAKADQTKKCSISNNVRKRVQERDNGECIFCQIGYHARSERRLANELGYQGRQIMHFVSRARGGLGIEENLAVGCTIHHMLYDNGAHGEHAEMKPLFAEYLSGMYPDWNEQKLIYSKWSGMAVK